MAITKITDPSAVPTTVADYEAQNIQLERLLGNSVQPYPVSGSNVVKGALFNIGGDMFYCGADTAISGTPSDYVKLVVSGSTATPSFVSSLSGVAWNPAYNGYYSGVDLYLFDEVKAVLAGAISGYKTAMGAMFETVRTQGISMKGATNVDRNIEFASDADLLWDESEDRFNFNKSCKITGELTATKSNLQNSSMVGNIYDFGDLYNAISATMPEGYSVGSGAFTLADGEIRVVSYVRNAGSYVLVGYFNLTTKIYGTYTIHSTDTTAISNISLAW